MEDRQRPYTLFGRRKGRRLRGDKPALLETLLPSLAIAPEPTPLNPATLFNARNNFWLEIGFGGGEHLAQQAINNPQIGLIGCEPFVNGTANLLQIISDKKINNIRIYPDDARMLIDRLPDCSIEKIFVLFPDPWPKARHADRRFIGPTNLPKLARILKTNGELRVASDDPILQDWMETHLQEASYLKAADHTQNGIYQTRPTDWPETRYEKKSLAKKKYAGWRGARYYSFRKI